MNTPKHTSIPGELPLWCVILVSVCCPSPAGAEPVTYGDPRQLATLENRDVAESSGLASSGDAGVLWTHNDSGDTPRIFAVDRDGQHRGEVQILGAAAVDWEDMASFRYHERRCLLLADVGDNLRQRSHCALYIVHEPKVKDRSARPSRVIRFRYEDGPQNCEAVAVDPTTLSVYLVTKMFTPSCRVYALPISDVRSSRLVARRIAQLPFSMVTAMDISPDGRRAIVLTYGHAFQFVRGVNEDWQAAFASAATEVSMPARRQGESICFGIDGRTLFLTSEGLPTPLWEVPAALPEPTSATPP